VTLVLEFAGFFSFMKNENVCVTDHDEKNEKKKFFEKKLFCKLIYCTFLVLRCIILSNTYYRNSRSNEKAIDWISF